MTLFERDWGFLVVKAASYRFDFLPRLTLATIPQQLEINLGFLWFQIWLTIWSRDMQEFNKNNQSPHDGI